MEKSEPHEFVPNALGRKTESESGESSEELKITESHLGTRRSSMTRVTGIKVILIKHNRTETAKAAEAKDTETAQAADNNGDKS
jgi:hypothetical protein